MPLTTEQKRKNEINELHDEICGIARVTLIKAIRIGELLTEQKDALKHGEWETWVGANLTFCSKTARNYMACFRFQNELKSETFSDLTSAYNKIREILKRADEAPFEREVKFPLDKSEAAIYDKHWKYLAQKVYFKESQKETILAALAAAYEEAGGEQ